MMGEGLPHGLEGGLPGGDLANFSPEALQQAGGAAMNPQMQQQMKQMMNDARLMSDIQAVEQAQMAAQQAQAAAQQVQQAAQQPQGPGQAPPDPTAAIAAAQGATQKLGSDYQNIKQGGGAISPQVEQQVRQVLGIDKQDAAQQQQAQQAPQGGQDPAGQAGPGGPDAGPQGAAPGDAGTGPDDAGMGPGDAGPGPGDAGPGGPTGPTDGPAGAEGPDQATATPPPDLSGDDRRQADFINDYLRQQGSPAAGQQAGELMVKYGKQYNVDPMALLAIAGQETVYGKKGIGVNGMLGVGAYDANPRNAVNNRSFSGVENQIRRGAQTFARLRARGGSNAQDSMGRQLAAVNRAGWATDRNWHNGVASHYNRIVRSANQYNQTHPAASAPTVPVAAASPAPTHTAAVEPTATAAPTQTAAVEPTAAAAPTQTDPAPTQTADASPASSGGGGGSMDA
jgi:hypothetical protein